MALEKGIELPELYKDASYVKSSHMRISSSQVPVRCNGVMSYGPLTMDGYGCCYNPHNNDINFACSAFHSDKNTSATNFANQLTQSLRDMQGILAKTHKSKL